MSEAIALGDSSSPVGLYRVRRKRETQRPYRVLLESVDPLRGSCSCPDFQRNALAACKHLLGVVDEIGARPRKLARALAAAPYATRGPRLVWDPMRPLTGPGRFDQSSSFLSSIERVVEPAAVPEPASTDAAEAIDEVATSGLEELLESADESGDPPLAPAGDGDTKKGRPAPARPPERAPLAGDIRGVLSQLEVERRADGGLRIEAPPEAAAELASLFDGLAQIMRKLAD